METECYLSLSKPEQDYSVMSEHSLLPLIVVPILLCSFTFGHRLLTLLWNIGNLSPSASLSEKASILLCLPSAISAVVRKADKKTESLNETVKDKQFQAVGSLKDSCGLKRPFVMHRWKSSSLWPDSDVCKAAEWKETCCSCTVIHHQTTPEGLESSTNTHLLTPKERETSKLNLCLCLQHVSLESPWFHSFSLVLVTCSGKMDFHFPVSFIRMWDVHVWVLDTISCLCCCAQLQLLSVHSWSLHPACVLVFNQSVKSVIFSYPIKTKSHNVTRLERRCIYINTGAVFVF